MERRAIGRTLAQVELEMGIPRALRDIASSNKASSESRRQQNTQSQHVDGEEQNTLVPSNGSGGASIL